MHRYVDFVQATSSLEEGAEPYPMKRVAEVDEVSGNILVST